MSRGFTLLELMVTIAVLAIVAGIGIPSFVNIIERNRVQTSADQFFTALIAARSEAVKRNQPVVLCKSTDGSSCSTSSSNYWEQGWLLYVDSVSANNVKNTGEPVVQVYSALANGISLRAADASNDADDYLAYLPDGTLSNAETFNVCIDSDTNRGRSIDLSVTGRPSREVGATACP